MTKLIPISLVSALISNLWTQTILGNESWPEARRIFTSNRSLNARGVIDAFDYDKCGKHFDNPDYRSATEDRYGRLSMEYPSFVDIEVKTSEFAAYLNCGGILISPELIITAATCVPRQTMAIRVRAGMVTGRGEKDRDYSNPRENAQRRFIKGYCLVSHMSAYNPLANLEDVAVLKTYEPFHYSEYVQPACIQIGISLAKNDKFVTVSRGRTRWEDWLELQGRGLMRCPQCDLSRTHQCYIGPDLPFDDGNPLYLMRGDRSNRDKHYAIGHSSFERVSMQDGDVICSNFKVGIQYLDYNEVWPTLGLLIENCANK